MASSRKIGVFGGSFDPPHNGHVFCARSAAEILGMEKILVVPAAIQPLKPDGATATASDRIDLVNAAFGIDGIFQISSMELERGGASFTIDTLRELKKIYSEPEFSLFLILGADVLADIPNWKEPAEIFRLSSVVSLRRTGAPTVDLPENWQVNIIELDTPLLDISSRQIRDLAAHGKSFEDLVPASVAGLIKARSLYIVQDGTRAS